MKRLSSSILLTYVIISVVGCAAGNWVTMKNGRPADVAESRIDRLRCEREAATTYPFAQVITSTSGGGFGSIGNSSTTDCSVDGNSVNCRTSGGIRAPAPTVTTQTTDGNASNRSRYFDECMAALGYESVFVPEPRQESTPRQTTPPPYRQDDTTVDSKDPAALTVLGERYARGDGVPKDSVRAVELFRKAASRGFAPAMNDLGVMYAKGEGVGQSYYMARDLYRLAAERGNVQANVNLGEVYERGLDVPINYKVALGYYRTAANMGSEKAKQRVEAIEKMLK